MSDKEGKYDLNLVFSQVQEEKAIPKVNVKTNKQTNITSQATQSLKNLLKSRSKENRCTNSLCW